MTAAPRKARFWDFEGRAGRREFILRGLPCVVFEVGYIAFLEAVAPDGLDSPFLLVPGFILLMAPMILAISPIIRRLHDLGRSALWAFAFAVVLRLLVAAAKWAGFPEAENPIFLIGIGGGLMYLALARGEDRENDFGPAPKRATG